MSGSKQNWQKNKLEKKGERIYVPLEQSNLGFWEFFTALKSHLVVSIIYVVNLDRLV
jgi:hypothetical protein